MIPGRRPPLAHRLLERALSPAHADAIIGDLAERRISGVRLWRETLVALWYLRDRRPHQVEPMSTFVADLRLALRLLGRAPTFTVTAVLTLGVAIGATTAIFSIANPVLIESLPYHDPDRVMMVWEQAAGGAHDNVGFATFRDYADRAPSVESAAAIGGWSPTLTDGGESEQLVGLRVSAAYFHTLGVRPALGRDFRPDEDAAGLPRVVILSNALWQRRFGGDSSVIGRSISLAGTPVTVVGVMPPDFDDVLQPGTQMWRVLGYSRTDPYACRTCRHLRMVVRLRPNATIEQARSELTRIHGTLKADYPKEYASVAADVVPLQSEVTGPYRPALLALAAAVALLLIIAIANVANLQLARLVRRSEEFAIRTALGARSARLMQQLLTESLVIAALGGLAGVVIAFLSIPMLVRRLPAGLPRADAIRLDPAALGVVAGIVLVLTLVVGLVPRRGRRVSNIADGLRAGRRLTGTRQSTFRAALVVTELALALVLLVSAGLLARSIVRLLDVDKGFDAHNLLTLQFSAVGPRYPDDASVWQQHDRIREALRALPGVASVAVANQLPLGGNIDRYGVVAQDNPPANPEDSPYGDRYVVSANYFETMRIPIVEGRAFTADDERDTTNKVVLVSQTLAARLWPDGRAIGKRIRMGGPDREFRTVIGVTRDVRHEGLDARQGQQFYVPERQWFFSDNLEVVIVRTQGDPLAVAGTVRQRLRALDPMQPIVALSSMDQVIARSTSQRRLALTLFAGFAIASLLLAVAGIYGVLAGNVAERTREIGLRTALGATPGRIVRLVLGEGVRLAAAGITIGLIGAFALSRALGALLFGVGPHDPSTIIGATVLLAVTAVAACLVPAYRALRVDPSEAFRDG